jgi:gas vesicle protein
MRQRRSGAGFWFGMTLGVMIGVALVILFIPHPGDAAAGDQSGAGGFNLLQRIQERFGPLIERVRARISEALALGQEFYQDAKEDVTTQYENAKSADLSDTL